MTDWLLPEYTGAHRVGTCLLERALAPSKHVELPFCPKVRTLKYRVYYPTTAEQGEHASWATPEQVRGYATFAGYPSLAPTLERAFSYFLSSIRLRAIEDAPPSPGKWPVVLFSHGLGGTDTLYSTVCGNLASHGAVVFAIEHRDHSASSTIIAGDEHVEYYSPVDQTKQEARLRARYMLTHRNYELRLLSGEVLRMAHRWHLDLDRASIVGHSFGAATCVHLLDSIGRGLAYEDLDGHEHTLEEPLHLQLRAATLLDIWTQPLGQLHLPDIPALHLVSTQFSQWPDNHDRLLEFAVDSPVVVHDSLHISQCDAGVMFPTFVATISGYRRCAQEIMLENVERAVDFMQQHGALLPSKSPRDLSRWAKSLETQTKQVTDLRLTGKNTSHRTRPRLLPRSSQAHTTRPPSWLRRFLQSTLLY
ncbi:hypothetical protein PYCC9005_003935 [Savitreella phatthalungensis]